MWTYLADPDVEPPRTPTCRVKRVAHDYAFTSFWLHLLSIVLLVTVVWECH